MTVVSAELHDVYEDCSPEWIVKSDDVIEGRTPVYERREIATIIEALTRKNSIPDQEAVSSALPRGRRLSGSDDRIDNLLDSDDRNAGFTKHYRTSADGEIDTLSGPASRSGYDTAPDILMQIRNSNLKKL